MIDLRIDVVRRGVLIATESHVIGRRFQLVELTDSTIRAHGLSGRARRQIDLVRIWQCLTRRGRWKWSIHDTQGAGIEIRFQAAF